MSNIYKSANVDPQKDPRTWSLDDVKALVFALVERSCPRTPDRCKCGGLFVGGVCASCENTYQEGNVAGPPATEPPLYIPKVGETVRVTAVHPIDPCPQHRVGDVCEAAQGTEPSLEQPGWLLLNSVTWCRVEPVAQQATEAPEDDSWRDQCTAEYPGNGGGSWACVLKAGHHGGHRDTRGSWPTDSGIIRAAEGVALEPGEYQYQNFTFGIAVSLRAERVKMEQGWGWFVPDNVGWVTAVRRVDPKPKEATCLGCGKPFTTPDHDQRCSSCVESGTGPEPVKPKEASERAIVVDSTWQFNGHGPKSESGRRKVNNFGSVLIYTSALDGSAEVAWERAEFLGCHTWVSDPPATELLDAEKRVHIDLPKQRVAKSVRLPTRAASDPLGICEPEQCHKYQSKLIADRDTALREVAELKAKLEVAERWSGNDESPPRRDLQRAVDAIATALGRPGIFAREIADAVSTLRHAAESNGAQLQEQITANETLMAANQSLAAKLRALEAQPLQPSERIAYDAVVRQRDELAVQVSATKEGE